MINQIIHCPHCERPNDAHDPVEPGRVPQDGDVSLCAGCGKLGIFEVRRGKTTLRQVTEEERERLESDPQIKIAQLALMFMKLGMLP